MELGNKWREIWSGIIPWIFSIWLYIGSLYMKSYTDNLFQPSFFPRILSAVLAVLGTIIIINAIKKQKILNKNIEEAEKTKVELKSKYEKNNLMDIVQKYTPYFTFVLIGIYLFFMPIVGFSISTVLYLFLQITLLSSKRSKKSLVIYFVFSVVTAIVVFFIFVYGFEVNLPLNQYRF